MELADQLEELGATVLALSQRVKANDDFRKRLTARYRRDVKIVGAIAMAAVSAFVANLVGLCF